MFPLQPGYVMTVCAEASNALAIQRSVDANMVGDVSFFRLKIAKRVDNDGRQFKPRQNRASVVSENALQPFRVCQTVPWICSRWLGTPLSPGSPMLVDLDDASVPAGWLGSSMNRRAQRVLCLNVVDGRDDIRRWWCSSSEVVVDEKMEKRETGSTGNKGQWSR